MKLLERFLTPRKRAERDEDDLLVSDAITRRAEELRQQKEMATARSLSVVAAREELFLQRLDEALEKAFSGAKITPAHSTKKIKKQPTDRILNLFWSDLHFHSLLDPREVPMKYGPQEEARRLAYLCLQASEYKVDHRGETELVINIAGDVIQNQLHDQRDGAPLAEQFAASVHLLIQAIVFLCGCFKKVTVNCVTGNHGRNTARHHGRATHQKWDSIETMVYYSIKKGVAHIKNVAVNIPYAPYLVYPVFDRNILITHGDSVFKPGNPSSSLDIKSIQEQTNAFNASRHDSEKVSLFCVGHVHTGATVYLPNGAIFMSNPALIPPDPFAVSIGVHTTMCGAQMWESTKGHVVGDQRVVLVDEVVDRDKALEKIIQPFSIF